MRRRNCSLCLISWLFSMMIFSLTCLRAQVEISWYSVYNTIASTNPWSKKTEASAAEHCLMSEHFLMSFRHKERKGPSEKGCLCIQLSSCSRSCANNWFLQPLNPKIDRIWTIRLLGNGTFHRIHKEIYKQGPTKQTLYKWILEKKLWNTSQRTQNTQGKMLTMTPTDQGVKRKRISMKGIYVEKQKLSWNDF